MRNVRDGRTMFAAGPVELYEMLMLVSVVS